MGKTTSTWGSRHKSLACVGGLALSALLPSALLAQTRPEVRLWQEALPYYNPAASIATEGGQIAALYGHEDSRNKYYLILGGMPLDLLGGQHEVGAQLLHHQQDLWEQTALSARGALRFFLGQTQSLHLGLETSFYRLSFDGKKAQEEGITNLELPTTKTEGKAFDLSLGAYYTDRRLSAGIAVTDVLRSSVALSERYRAQTSPLYVAFLRYHIEWGQSFALQPTAFASYSKPLGWRKELGASISYQDRFSLGASYRFHSAWIAHTSIRLGDLRLGYLLERDTRTKSSPSYRHEIFLGYTLPLTQGSKEETRYKSIRLL